jgi:hypothetical protein
MSYLHQPFRIPQSIRHGKFNEAHIIADSMLRSAWGYLREMDVGTVAVSR